MFVKPIITVCKAIDAKVLTGELIGNFCRFCSFVISMVRDKHRSYFV